MKKQAILELLRLFPEEVDTEEFIHRVRLIEKLARAEEDIAAGRVVSHAAVKERIRSWRSRD
jgi:predicted transcriptional regulator